jgi:hypothetical protein
MQAILKKEAKFSHVDNLPRSVHPFKLSKAQRIHFSIRAQPGRSWWPWQSRSCRFTQREEEAWVLPMNQEEVAKLTEAAFIFT